MHDDTGDLLSAYLDRYSPGTTVEAVEVEQVRALARAGDPWNRSSRLHVTASALIVHPPSRRVLLRWHERQQAWLQVGGHGDPAERDPLAVAQREGTEETGLVDLEPWPQAELRHVVIVPVPASEREPAHHHADVRFFLATRHPDLARPEHPGAELRWLSVDDAEALTTEDNVKETIARAALLLDDL